MGKNRTEGITNTANTKGSMDGQTFAYAFLNTR